MQSRVINVKVNLNLNQIMPCTSGTISLVTVKCIKAHRRRLINHLLRLRRYDIRKTRFKLWWLTSRNIL